MKQEHRGIVIGVGLLFGSITLDAVGSELHSLVVLVVSFVFGVAGAVVALRGMVDFLSERF
jgi:hypothetical protein